MQIPTVGLTTDRTLPTQITEQLDNTDVCTEVVDNVWATAYIQSLGDLQSTCKVKTCVENLW